jgi:hypothetical protein
VLQGSELQRQELDREKGEGSVAQRAEWLRANGGHVSARRYPFDSVTGTTPVPTEIDEASIMAAVEG